MREILIVGGGYAGFYTAWGLEKRLRRGEARVTVVDPRPYMTSQPFLPEVLAGSVEARHAAEASAPDPSGRGHGDGDPPQRTWGDRPAGDRGPTSTSPTTYWW